MPNEMQLYEDKDCTVKLDRIDLGRISLGESTEVIAFLKNESDRWPIQNIKLNESDKEVNVHFPEMLVPGEIAQVTIEFHPSLNRRDPLDIKHLFVSELWIG